MVRDYGAAALGLGLLIWVSCLAFAFRAVVETADRAGQPAGRILLLAAVLPPVGMSWAAAHDMRGRGRTGWAYGLLTLLVWPIGVLTWLVDRRRFPRAG